MEKIFQKPELQRTEKKEPKEDYLNETFLKVKGRLQEYLPNLYRNIPTKLNYQDKAENLKTNYHFEGDNLNINIETPEDLSGKTIDDLKESEIPFLVFQDVAGDKTIPKKMQDFFFLLHEYVHGIHQKLLKEYRPGIIQIIERKKKEFLEADESEKKQLQEEEKNSIFPVLGESLPISVERIMVERILQDKTIDNQERDNVRNFWENHEKSLLEKKLENDPKLKYSEFDEAMIYYKIYLEFKEEGILNFIKNFKLEELSKVKKYSDSEQRILSEEYKKILDMNADEIMKKFAPDRLKT